MKVLNVLKSVYQLVGIRAVLMAVWFPFLILLCTHLDKMSTYYFLLSIKLNLIFSVFFDDFSTPLPSVIVQL